MFSKRNPKSKTEGHARSSRAAEMASMRRGTGGRRRTIAAARAGLFAATCMIVGMTLVPHAVQAQSLPGCTATTLQDPERQVLDCGNGLVIDKEAAASLTSQTPQSSLELGSDAVLIEVSPRDSFQVLTPHAIATVRGTVFAVDTQEGVTSVFVVKGKVEVTRRDGSDPVLLGPGDGVDVREGEPLTVRQWPQPRVVQLLARFGR
ncbi:anti-sigma 24 factor [Jiella endophytica]|uniref:Anti-sigma 24 factor n=2 Tax=Jiella endophytica TaxID=2558362 RepID=A0A4Y8RTA6_9HYPH|nr:anti-sigma 24 factor [Jiella endophytica]